MSQTQITFSQVRAKAEELSTQNAQFNKQVESLKEIEGRLFAKCKGGFVSTFHTNFQRESAYFNNFYVAIQDYIQKLRSAADKLQRADEQSAQLIN